MTGNLWQSTHAATIDLDNFRAHDQYLEQRKDFPYEATDAFIRSRGLSHWLSLLGEDGAFGCETRVVNGLTVSRDLLDSILELDFLGRACGSDWLDARLVLDIGSGYGRFAHRYMRLHTGSVYCVDPIPVSRVVCSRYLHHRGLPPELVLAPEELHVLPPVDLAVNIHSWSECHLDEVCAWLDWLVDHHVPRLFIVPHDPGFHTWHGPSYLPELASRWYDIVHHWVGPPCKPKHYYLFERVGV